ncbi:MAG: peroxidase family protein [Planctomycetaceae bacterium]
MSQDLRARCRRANIETLEWLLLMSAGSVDALATGTDGHDVLVASTPGQTLDGMDGNDTLFGIAGDNTLIGGDGQDYLFPLLGNNIVDGGSGNDIVYFWGVNREDAQVKQLADGKLSFITANATTQVSNVETFHFRDRTVALEDLNAEPEYRSIDGAGNNPINPEIGSINQQLLRLAAPEYADGIAAPAGDDRPHARFVSNELSSQSEPEPNDRQLTDITWLWGQFLDHDISLSEAAYPAEPFNIHVPAGDHLFDAEYTGNSEIAFHRSVFDTSTGDSIDNPRQQINQITTFIDGSMIYGSDDDRAAQLRSFSDGHLRIADDNLLIRNDIGLNNHNGNLPEAQLFLAGDVRVNENVALTAMHTLWVREHNQIADQLAARNPSLTDEQLYQRARRQVVAQVQAITYNEFLPALLGVSAIDDYAGYDPHVDPSVATEFSAAAFRFGHTMLPSELLRLNNDGSVIDGGNLALRDAFFAPEEIMTFGIDSVLFGATQQLANEVDLQIVDDVRNFLFGQPGSGGFDLASLNIQRGRDHGLADYNDIRESLGLARVTDFSDITSDADVQQRLERVYGSVDNIDLWIGGLAEDHVTGSSMGETFGTIIADQFTRLRDGDRFWYENIFEGEELTIIESTTLADVIRRNTGVEDLQHNVFFAAVA